MTLTLLHLLQDAAAAAAKRAEAEEALRESAAALQAVRDELEQAQANAQVAQKELAKLRAQQQVGVKHNLHKASMPLSPGYAPSR